MRKSLVKIASDRRPGFLANFYWLFYDLRTLEFANLQRIFIFRILNGPSGLYGAGG
jgi:hypothetical protein